MFGGSHCDQATAAAAGLCFTFSSSTGLDCHHGVSESRATTKAALLLLET